MIFNPAIIARAAPCETAQKQEIQKEDRVTAYKMLMTVLNSLGGWGTVSHFNGIPQAQAKVQL